MEREFQIEVLKNFRLANWVLVSASFFLLIANSNFGLGQFEGVEEEIEFYEMIGGYDFQDLNDDVVMASVAAYNNTEQIKQSQLLYISHRGEYKYRSFRVLNSQGGGFTLFAKFDEDILVGEVMGYFPKAKFDESDQYELPRAGIIKNVADISNYWNIMSSLDEFTLVLGFDPSNSKAYYIHNEVSKLEEGIKEGLSHTIIKLDRYQSNKKKSEMLIEKYEMSNAENMPNIKYEEHYTTAFDKREDGTPVLVLTGKAGDVTHVLEVPLITVNINIAKLPVILGYVDKVNYTVFKDAFPITTSLVEDFEELEITSLKAFMELLKRNSSKTSSILGNELSPSFLLDYGAYLIAVLQAYFYLHFRHFSAFLLNAREKSLYMWVALYRDKGSQALFAISIVILPCIASIQAISLQLKLNSSHLITLGSFLCLLINIPIAWLLVSWWKRETKEAM